MVRAGQAEWDDNTILGHVQGDHSGMTKPPVYFKTKVPLGPA